MIAILGGLGASLCFATSALCASAASREVGPMVTLAGVMLFGLLLVVPPTLFFANAGQLTVRDIILLAIAGGTNVLGLRIEYIALRRGKVGVVVPIVSTEGVIAAVIAIIAGLHLSLRTAVLLVFVTVGVMLAAAHPDPPHHLGKAPGVRSGVLALPVALLFGICLYTTGRVGRDVSVLWVLLSARVFGALFIAMPLARRRPPRPSVRALLLMVTGGAAEVFGLLSFTLGARHQLAVAAVLASQFAALAAIGAYFFFHERLARSQILGLIVVGLCVGLLAGT